MRGPLVTNSCRIFDCDGFPSRQWHDGVQETNLPEGFERSDDAVSFCYGQTSYGYIELGTTFDLVPISRPNPVSVGDPSLIRQFRTEPACLARNTSLDRRITCQHNLFSGVTSPIGSSLALPPCAPTCPRGRRVPAHEIVSGCARGIVLQADGHNLSDWQGDYRNHP